MSALKLTPEQEAEAQRLAEIIAAKAKEEALQMARLLVSKPDRELLGATEFEIRDRVHRIGGKKGVSRVEHDVSALWCIRQVCQLSRERHR